MAEGWNRNLYCRSFVAGDTCRSPFAVESTRIPLFTNPTSNNSSGVSSRTNRSFQPHRSPSRERLIPPCRYFRRGNCIYGRSCRFLHIVDGNGNKPNNWAHSSAGSRSIGSPENSTSVGNGDHSRKPSNYPHSATIGFINAELADQQDEDWVNAPEFIPSSKDKNAESKSLTVEQKVVDQTLESKLCPQLESGECENGADCPYLHGDICELCGQACLNPHDSEQRKKHNNECIKQHEQDMELSFAVARSKDKACGICFETIMEKSLTEQRFGILPNCSHCFCLTCIRKWRQSKQFEHKIVRSCPECRVTSDFVCPSMYWVDTKEDKDKLISDYKGALSVKNCKYFRAGKGKCPFGNKCFYLHALPDGTKKDVGPPVRRRHRRGSDEDFHALLQFFVWDFLDEFEDFVTFSSDSEDSYESEYDFFLE